MMVSKLAVPGAVARNIHWYLRYLGMLLLQTFDVTTNRGPLASLVSQLQTKLLSATPFIILHFSYRRQTEHPCQYSPAMARSRKYLPRSCLSPNWAGDNEHFIQVSIVKHKAIQNWPSHHFSSKLKPVRKPRYANAKRTYG